MMGDVLDSDPHDAPSAVARHRHRQSDDARQLRRTRDYRALTAVVQELRRQREQALHDIARLALLRERALAAPVPFVLRLKRDRACLDDSSSSSHDGNSDANAAARGGGRGQGDRDDDDDAERPQHDAEEESFADDPAAGPMLPLPRRQFVARLPRVDLHRYAYASRPRGPRRSTTTTTTPTTTTATASAAIATTTTTLSSLAVASGEKEATHEEGREMSERVASSSNASITHHDAGDDDDDDNQMDEVLDGGQVPSAGTGTARETDSSAAAAAAAAAGLQRIKQEEAERPTGHGEGRHHPHHHHDDDDEDVHVAPVAAGVKREGGVKEEFPPDEGSLPREEPKAGDVIRGRVWDEDKPSTFNKLWTPDEQRRLELLLLEIPDEEVAAHRWSKIARALGNRTPRQVASRVQKYFIKLARAGLPVPGKPPNLDVCLRKRRKTAHHHHQQQQQQPTHSGAGSGLEGAAAYYTLPPVQMPDDDDEEDDDDDGDDGDEEKEEEEEVGDDNGEVKGTLGAQPAASLAEKGEGQQQQQPYDDEDYRTYRAQAPNYLDPAFMPS